MAAPETCSTVPESPEPEPCDGPQLDQDQDQNQNKKEEEDEDEDDEGSELQNREPSDPECVEERFRIDRKKLELMLYGVCLINVTVFCRSFIKLFDFSTQTRLETNLL